MLFIEVQLNFTLPGTFGLTELILAVACAPVAQGGEPWEVSGALGSVSGSGPCAGAQLLLCLAGREHWWCWDFPLAAQLLPCPLHSAASAACSAWPTLLVFSDVLSQTGSLVSGLSTCIHNTCFWKHGQRYL